MPLPPLHVRLLSRAASLPAVRGLPWSIASPIDGRCALAACLATDFAQIWTSEDEVGDTKDPVANAGPFTSRTIRGRPGGILSATTVDLDGDGNPEIVVGGGEKKLWVLKRGTGQWWRSDRLLGRPYPPCAIRSLAISRRWPVRRVGRSRCLPAPSASAEGSPAARTAPTPQRPPARRRHRRHVLVGE